MEPEYELAFKVASYIDLIWDRDELQEFLAQEGKELRLEELFKLNEARAALEDNKFPTGGKPGQSIPCDSDDAMLRDAIETVSLYRDLGRFRRPEGVARVVPVADPDAPARTIEREVSRTESEGAIAKKVCALLKGDLETLHAQLSDLKIELKPKRPSGLRRAEMRREKLQRRVRAKLRVARMQPAELRPTPSTHADVYDKAAPTQEDQPSFETIRRELARAFYHHPERAAKVAEGIDYFPSFTVELAQLVQSEISSIAEWKNGRPEVRRMRLSPAKGSAREIMEGFLKTGPGEPRDDWSKRRETRLTIEETLRWLVWEIRNFKRQPTDEASILRELCLLFLAKPLLGYYTARYLRVPVPFGIAYGEELDEMYYSRLARGETGDIRDEKWFDPYECGEKMKLSGLCFSGGGIRSATFNLGVLQGLADLKVLHKFDYLSTVSGGGYIGSWLAAWTLRAGTIKTTQAFLQRKRRLNPLGEDLHPIRRLREYSHYLTPQSGAVTTDTLTLVAVYLRNVSLNQTLLMFAFLAFLFLPLLFYPLLNGETPASGILLVAGWLAIAVFSVAAGASLRVFKPNTNELFFRSARWLDAGFVEKYVVAPAIPAAIIIAFAFWRTSMSPPGPDQLPALFIRLHIDWVWATFMVCAIGVIYVHFAGGWEPWRKGGLVSVLRHVGLVVPAAAAGACFWGLKLLFDSWTIDTQTGSWKALVFGPPLVLSAWSITIVTYLGILGLAIGEERREWWARLGALIGKCSVVWLLLTSLSVYGPLVLSRFLVLNISLATVWTTITGLGLKLGTAAPKSSGNGGTSVADIARKLLVAIAPFVFIAGLFLFLSWAAFRLAAAWHFSILPTDVLFAHYWQIMGAISMERFWLFAIFTVFALILGFTLGVNEFSMHNFYKNRLIRAYLAASRPSQRRSPNPFTGFDTGDDIPLARFRVHPDLQDRKNDLEELRPSYIGPFLILNTTLNVTKGQDLALQERKGESFTFTPLRCGFHYTRPRVGNLKQISREFAYYRTESYARPGGPTIGDAMTISGAAANPSWGSSTSTGTAFLLTLFNIRLGSWIGNPAGPKAGRSSPLFGLLYLIYNLFGSSDSASEYVNLSDGGHFDNSGLYELIRRRTKYIMICDAEEDQDYTFGAIGGAIRKARVDFAADIRLDVRNLIPVPGSNSKCHCAAGEVIYDDQSEGKLLYLKLTLDGAEPTDILEYKKRAPAFPHQSTVDQFFSESQFESYRILGYYSTQLAWKRAFESAKADPAQGGLGAVFEEFSNVWPKPSFSGDDLRPHYDQVLSAHTWGPAAKVSVTDALERVAVTHRIYHELRLWDESEGDLYSNQGICQILAGWKQHPTQQKAWQEVREIYEPSFHRFYEQTLN